ncbi:SpoIIE family protein phosphatase [Geodermatophilus sp. YIM 151500]|uniref:SpoIIE family protein phosphatase n=1 Tax=Geodermatophilus sp. YIM 151500 TaxID=2984531 RepID=UPI0021E4A496|nr:SpoIIE family protein phosphatase [Geodermatophilus sp. YIM 151500]MCV2491835.1 SpoIIE family protein phosphatase [Geodermatophilus sp. YIM 151500]
MPPDRDPPEPDRVVPPEVAAAVASGRVEGPDRAPMGEALSADTERDLGRQAGIVTAASAAVSEQEERGNAASALPGVLAGVPVAVLVIDQKAGSVTYANAAAVELAGNVRLPVDVDRWGAAAGLTDLNGHPLASTSGPLSMVAQGRPVTGEAVRLSPGRSSVRERAEQDSGADDRLLWVTGFPLSQTGSPEQLALVVFLEVERTPTTDPEAQLQALRERAVVATDITFTITDPRQPDNPLVWVNPSFSRVTGYSPDEAIGRNCRFLQGAATDRAAIEEIRQGLAARRQITTTLLNYRKDGTAFWNQLSINPVFDGTGELVSYVGVQTDVTERVRVEGEREAAFAAERAARKEAELAQAVAEQARTEAERARAAAERAQSRLALMAEATSTMSATLVMEDLLDRLAGLAVPLLCDWVYVTLTDEYGTVRGAAYRHRDGREDDLELFTSLHVMHLPDSSPSRRSMMTARPVLLADVTDEVLETAVVNPVAREAFRRLGGCSVLTVPMVARRRTLGAMALVSASPDRRFTQDDVDLAEDLARRAALAIDNVRLYQREHTVADTLQRSLLPDLPEIPGIESAAHYASASTAADVGGDFYDLLRLPDGSVGIVVGDVVGHDVAAAAAMGHLRGLIRACVWDAEDPTPGVVLTRVDRLVQGLNVASMATMVYARAVPPTGEGEAWRLHAANAGHPPLLLRGPEGEVRLLDGVSGLLVGVDDSTRRITRIVDVPPGSTLVAYTDGLIERPGSDLDAGIAELAERLAAAPVGAGPAQLCEAAVGGALDRRDDVAVIAVRFS